MKAKEQLGEVFERYVRLASNQDKDLAEIEEELLEVLWQLVAETILEIGEKNHA